MFTACAETHLRGYDLFKVMHEHPDPSVHTRAPAHLGTAYAEPHTHMRAHVVRTRGVCAKPRLHAGAVRSGARRTGPVHRRHAPYTEPHTHVRVDVVRTRGVCAKPRRHAGAVRSGAPTEHETSTPQLGHCVSELGPQRIRSGWAVLPARHTPMRVPFAGDVGHLRNHGGRRRSRNLCHRCGHCTGSSRSHEFEGLNSTESEDWRQRDGRAKRLIRSSARRLRAACGRSGRVHGRRKRCGARDELVELAYRYPA